MLVCLVAECVDNRRRCACAVDCQILTTQVANSPITSSTCAVEIYWGSPSLIHWMYAQFFHLGLKTHQRHEKCSWQKSCHIFNTLINDNTNLVITHTHTQPFNGLLSGTTRVGRYLKKHSPTHTQPDHRTFFISFLYLQRSTASSLFILRFWQSSRTKRHYENLLDFCGAGEDNGGRGTDSPGGRHSHGN